MTADPEQLARQLLERGGLTGAQIDLCERVTAGYWEAEDDDEYEILKSKDSQAVIDLHEMLEREKLLRAK